MFEPAGQPENRLVRIERLLENVLRELARGRDRDGAEIGPADILARLIVVLERTERRLTITNEPMRRRNPSTGWLSARAAARRLGIGRDTLARLVQARIIPRVPRGERSAFRAADVEALIERGYTLPSGRKAMRRRPIETNAAPVQRIADLPY
jgi:excisionase family DNA binding protein